MKLNKRQAKVSTFDFPFQCLFLFFILVLNSLVCPSKNRSMKAKIEIALVKLPGPLGSTEILFFTDIRVRFIFLYPVAYIYGNALSFLSFSLEKFSLGFLHYYYTLRH
jgi:hypothetical protein